MSKKLSNVFEEICSVENLRKAAKKAAKDKKHHEEVLIFQENEEELLQQLSEMLLNQTYSVTEDDYVVFYKKTSSGKVRKLKKLKFYPHRIVQHAILIVLSERWVKTLTFDCYNCIPGRGINSKNKEHNFVAQMKTAMLDKDYSLFGLVLDIEDFYNSVDNRRHSGTYRRDIKDRRLLWLLDMFTFSTDGLTIGGPDSQIKSHLELRYLDRFIKEVLGAKYYFRYADDMVLLSNSKEELHQWQWRIMNYLYYERKLITKHTRSIVRTKDGIDVCGYVFFPEGPKLRKRIKKSIIKKRHSPKSMSSYNGIMKHCNAKNFIKTVIINDNKHMDITQLDVKVERRFSGELIKIEKLQDETISILDYEVRPSDKRKGTYWLMMQVLYNGEKRFMKGGYSILCTFLQSLDDKMIGDKTGMTEQQIIDKRRSFLPLTNVVIKQDKGYYFQGTLN